MSKNKRKQLRSNEVLLPANQIKSLSSDSNVELEKCIDLSDKHFASNQKLNNENVTMPTEQCSDNNDDNVSKLDVKEMDFKDINDSSENDSSSDAIDDVEKSLERVSEIQLEHHETIETSPVAIHFAVNPKTFAEMDTKVSALDLLSRGYGPK